MNEYIEQKKKEFEGKLRMSMYLEYVEGIKKEDLVDTEYRISSSHSTKEIIEDLIKETQEEAVRGFVEEVLLDSAEFDEEIGIDTAMEKTKRWVNIDSVREQAEQYLQTLKDKI